MPKPTLYLDLRSLKRHVAENSEAFLGLSVSVETLASPTTIYDRDKEELVLLIEGRSGPGAILYRRRTENMGVTDGLMMRFPDWVRPKHLQEALYGNGQRVREVARLHHLLMQLPNFKKGTAEAMMIVGAVAARIKVIEDAISALKPSEAH